MHHVHEPSKIQLLELNPVSIALNARGLRLVLLLNVSPSQGPPPPPPPASKLLISSHLYNQVERDNVEQMILNPPGMTTINTVQLAPLISNINPPLPSNHFFNIPMFPSKSLKPKPFVSDNLS